MTATIRAEHVYPHPPARVWAALTDPAKVSRWLMPTELVAEPGARFTLDAGEWGKVQCEVTGFEPERRLAYTWRREPLDTTVTWTLVPEDGGTHLVLEHAGFDLDHPQQRFAHQNMAGGWTMMMTSRLPMVLGEG